MRIHRGGETIVPPHLSKEQDIPLSAGDRVELYHPVTIDPKAIPKKKPAAKDAAGE